MKQPIMFDDENELKDHIQKEIKIFKNKYDIKLKYDFIYNIKRLIEINYNKYKIYPIKLIINKEFSDLLGLTNLFNKEDNTLNYFLNFKTNINVEFVSFQNILLNNNLSLFELVYDDNIHKDYIQIYSLEALVNKSKESQLNKRFKICFKNFDDIINFDSDKNPYDIPYYELNNINYRLDYIIKKLLFSFGIEQNYIIEEVNINLKFYKQNLKYARFFTQKQHENKIRNKKEFTIEKEYLQFHDEISYYITFNITNNIKEGVEIIII